MPDLICPSCNIELTQKRAKGGRIFWGCPNWPECNVSVGAHQKTGKPLGTPADTGTKEWRIKAHKEFDRLWKDGGMSRSEAYLWLTRQMKLGREAHIAEMDITQCRKVIGLVKLKNPTER
jgi:ssDNA-binding Zn-finger/Zn-ribbon topoisomerase 1